MATTSSIESARILVVDDDESIRNLTKRALEREGFKCHVAPNVPRAETMLKSGHYDLLVADIRIPGKHGHALITETIRDYPDLKIVAITGVAEPRLVLDLMERGVDDIMFKPLQYEVFVAKLQGILRRKQNAAAQHNVLGVSEQLATATETLDKELSRITKSFQTTIAELEQQRDTIESGFIGSVRVLSNLVSQVETEGTSHAARVERLAVAIAEKAGDVPRDDMRDLKIAALLHEIGQFGMPDKIRVLPPWKLTGAQRKSYERYPVIGAALLSEVPGSSNVVELIESHCENYDGSGFPDGKKGLEIPYAARIIHIADGCDSVMMHNEPDKALAAARKHVRSEAGKAYDPDLVNNIFKALPDSELEVGEPGTTSVTAAGLQPGMVLAENVHDEEGRFLARQGAELTEQMIPRLVSLLSDRHVQIVEPGA